MSSVWWSPTFVSTKNGTVSLLFDELNLKKKDGTTVGTALLIEVMVPIPETELAGKGSR